jgi:ectoine hydroxylase
MKLSESQLREFDEKGYLFFPELISAPEVHVLLDEVEVLAARETDGNLKEKSGVARQFYNSHRDSRAYKALSGDARILTGVRQLVGNDVYIWHSKINVKAAFEGTVWLWHQDYGYWFHDGVDPKIVSCMVSLDEATHENGCLMVIPGSHKLGRLEHFPDEVTTSYKQWTIPIDMMREITRDRQIVSLTGKPGSVLLFHCNLIHGSNHNMTSVSRRSVIFAYNDVANTPRAVPNPRPDYVVSRRFDVVQLEEENALLKLAEASGQVV